MIDLLLASVGVLALLVAATAKRMHRWPVSEPLLGLVAGVVLGPGVTGVLTVPTVVEEHGVMHEGTRVLLAVSVMAVALRFPVSTVRGQARPVLLLLALAMPAMALLTAASTWLVLGVGLVPALLIGAACAPTDPVLASSVVSGEPAERDLPERDRVLLSIESGANDGLALPLVLLAVAVAGATDVGRAAGESVWQLVGATVVGVAGGLAGALVLKEGEKHRSTDPGPQLLFTLLLALALLGLAGLLHVDAILAVFIGGLVFNVRSTGRERGGAVSIDEAINRFLVLPVFVLLGAALPWREWQQLGWRGPALLAAVLLVRRLPVLIALKRPLRLGWADAAYLGWFGPLGVSALFYLSLEAKRLDLDPVVLAAGTLLVAGSTVVHGLTSSPGRVLYARVRGRGRSAVTSG